MNPLKSLPASLSEGLRKIWAKQRRLLRDMDTQRQKRAGNMDVIGTEIITDAYYLVRKNLSELLSLKREVVATEEGRAPTATAQSENRVTIASTIGSLRDLAREYAELRARFIAAQADDVSTMLDEHGRQLDYFVDRMQEMLVDPKR